MHRIHQIRLKSGHLLHKMALVQSQRSRTVHALCFINNVYKQRFLRLVKIFKNLNNDTSQSIQIKQQVKINQTTRN